MQVNSGNVLGYVVTSFASLGVYDCVIFADLEKLVLAK